MTGSPAPSLLDAEEPRSFQLINPDAASAFVLTCEHASARIPRQLQQLGLAPDALARHIAVDLGAAQVTSELAGRLDAWAILQNYSRLVIDCNRPLDAPDSIVARSDGTVVPGNHQLSAAQVYQRQVGIFQPYHDCIRKELDRRQHRAQPTILVAIHSFTPELAGRCRPWHAGVLYHRDDRLARLLLSGLRAQDGAVIGDNEPYSVSDTTDFTIPVHGEQRSLLHAEIELRQDLLTSDGSRALWVERLAAALREAEIQLLSYCHN